MAFQKFDIRIGLARLQKALDKGMLANQHNKYNTGKLKYEDGSVCAIGAMFNQRVIAEADEKTAHFRGLVERGIIDVPEQCASVWQEDMDALLAAHDNSLPLYLCPKDTAAKVTKEAWNNFISVFERIKKKYGVGDAA